MFIAIAWKISQCCPTKCIQLVAIVKQKGREEVIAAHSFRNIVPVMLSYSKKIKEMKVQCKTKYTVSYIQIYCAAIFWMKKEMADSAIQVDSKQLQVINEMRSF